MTKSVGLPSYKRSYLSIIYGLDSDKYARKYSTLLSKKYQSNEDLVFVDFSSFDSKLYPLKAFSELSVVSIGVHSHDCSFYPIDLQLEVCKKSVCHKLGKYLKENKLIDDLIVIPQDFWELSEYPSNFSLLEIFARDKALQRFERMLLESLNFLKEKFLPVKLRRS